MSDQTITSLIEKLEGAEVGSRELDALVAVALKLDCKPNLPDDLHWLRPIQKDDHCAPGTYWFVQRSGMSLRTSEPVTTSLDAALALAERVLPGWWWTAGRCGLTCHASVGPDSKFIGEPDLSKFDSGFHADVPNPSTPAIALCIAILRAQSEARV